jgi:hypothetical protein
MWCGVMVGKSTTRCECNAISITSQTWQKNTGMSKQRSIRHCNSAPGLVSAKRMRGDTHTHTHTHTPAAVHAGGSRQCTRAGEPLGRWPTPTTTHRSLTSWCTRRSRCSCNCDGSGPPERQRQCVRGRGGGRGRGGNVMIVSARHNPVGAHER